MLLTLQCCTAKCMHIMPSVSLYHSNHDVTEAASWPPSTCPRSAATAAEDKGSSKDPVGKEQYMQRRCTRQWRASGSWAPGGLRCSSRRACSCTRASLPTSWKGENETEYHCIPMPRSCAGRVGWTCNLRSTACFKQLRGCGSGGGRRGCSSARLRRHWGAQHMRLAADLHRGREACYILTCVHSCLLPAAATRGWSTHS